MKNLEKKHYYIGNIFDTIISIPDVNEFMKDENMGKRIVDIYRMLLHSEYVKIFRKRKYFYQYYLGMEQSTLFNFINTLVGNLFKIRRRGEVRSVREERA
uniref:Uncharacterized protein n=1 Tax=Staphylothermus marinus TaxID=2280 RepID=A0A7J3KHR1_STAMA